MFKRSKGSRKLNRNNFKIDKRLLNHLDKVLRNANQYIKNIPKQEEENEKNLEKFKKRLNAMTNDELESEWEKMSSNSNSNTNKNLERELEELELRGGGIFNMCRGKKSCVNENTTRKNSTKIVNNPMTKKLENSIEELNKTIENMKKAIERNQKDIDALTNDAKERASKGDKQGALYKLKLRNIKQQFIEQSISKIAMLSALKDKIEKAT
jgi:uncharacterized coiled-coil protein SlyX